MIRGLSQIPERRLTFYASSILAIITLLLYWPARGFDFIVVDDNEYVFQNPHVIKGLSWGGIKWAFFSFDASNWHPLTWVSHMLDCSLYGLFPGGHHITGILFHTANTVLLFLLLKRLTAALWPSAFVAALFAWHPLHVESVAWICERKDVLSMFFLLLTIWAYSRYVRRPTRGNYLLALALFALGLMSKPMLVTLPCLLLLLDYWPLKRIEPAPGQPQIKKQWLKLVMEKIPFFFLSALGCMMTMGAQSSSGAVKSMDQFPLMLRVTNALGSYGLYLAKAIWPTHLAVYYPLPTAPPWGLFAASMLLLLAITGVAFAWRSRFPWLIIGWFWFLGTLVPVIGLVQVGTQAMADRYTYIPYIGLFVMLAWSVDYWVKKRDAFCVVALPVCIAVLVGCTLVARAQLGYWRGSIPLFEHALQVTASNKFSSQNLKYSRALASSGADPLPRYRALLNPTPTDRKARYDLTFEDISYGRLNRAVTELSETLNYNPRSDTLHNNLGIVLFDQNKLDEALEEFQKAVELNRKSPWPRFNGAIAYQEKGMAQAAVSNYAKALELRPDWPEALDKLAFLRATCPELQRQDPARAVQLAAQANQLTSSNSPVYLRTLAATSAAAGNFPDAARTAELARDKAQAGGFQTVATNLQNDLTFYRDGKSASLDWRSPPIRVALSRSNEIRLP
jgi:tetratricopeptide (TPR) repeat protein